LPAEVCAILTRRTNSHLATCHLCRDDGADADMALHEPHLTLRDGRLSLPKTQIRARQGSVA
jgi:hypothetical protein